MLVELVGPAGSGKSLLAERLRARGDVVRASVWNLPRGLIFESALRSLPLLLRHMPVNNGSRAQQCQRHEEQDLVV